MNLVRADLASGKLERPLIDWAAAIHHAAELARLHAAASGCRSLDVLHCAVASAIDVEQFVSSDRRQITLAAATGLRVTAI